MEFPNDKLQQYISQIEELIARMNWIIENHDAAHNLLMTRLYAKEHLRELKEELIRVVIGEN